MEARGSGILDHTGLHIPESNKQKKKEIKKKKTENKCCNKCEASSAFRIFLGPGETVQQLRMLTVVAEDLSWVLSIHMVVHSFL